MRILFFLALILLANCTTTPSGGTSAPVAATPAPVQTVTVNGRVITQQAPTARPAGNAAYGVRIAWVIPNADAEVFGIANYSDSAADVRGWILRDLKSWTWKLDSLSPIPARTMRVLYSDQRQLVNNTGDTLFLITGSSVEVHRFGFGATQRGDTVKAR
jgi:hypothetical protein